MVAGLSSARTSVLRSALLFLPFLAVSAFGLAFIIGDVVSAGFDAGHVVGICLVGFVTLLLGYQVVQSIRDLFSSCVETVGAVERQWSRNEFILFRNGYIFVRNNVFRLTPDEYINVKLGDTVRVVHYPHTATVESVEVVERAKAS
jgi:xanthosine utilization system XapX-like protein